MGYLAPEVLSGHYQASADVFSFGLILYEIFSGRPAFEGMMPLQIVNALDKNIRPSIPEDLPVAVQELIANCWAHDPKQRPTFKEVVALLANLLNEKR